MIGIVAPRDRWRNNTSTQTTCSPASWRTLASLEAIEHLIPFRPFGDAILIIAPQHAQSAPQQAQSSLAQAVDHAAPVIPHPLIARIEMRRECSIMFQPP